MRIALRLLMGSVLAASVVGVATPAQSQRAPSVVYSSAESDFVVGKTVYLKSSKMRIGTILKTDDNHKFPRAFPRPRMKAVLIRRKDGPYEWTPVERITRIYVVNK